MSRVLGSRDHECPRGQRSRERPAPDLLWDGEEDKGKTCQRPYHSQSAKPGVLVSDQSNSKERGLGP